MTVADYETVTLLRDINIYVVVVVVVTTAREIIFYSAFVCLYV